MAAKGARAGRLLLVLGLGTLGGCATAWPQLRPDETAQQVPGRKYAALAEEGGVQVRVDADAWRSLPPRPKEFVPLKVSIRNGSPHPLRVQLKNLALEAPGGARVAALPPQDIEGVAYVDAPVSGPWAPGSVSLGLGWGWGGSWGPGWGGGWGWPYDAWGAYGGPGWGWGPWGSVGWGYPYWGPSYVRMPVELPTRDMLERALPERVVPPGEQLQGYVYFPRPPRDVKEVTFRAQLVDADSGEPLAQVAIPFDVRG